MSDKFAAAFHPSPVPAFITVVGVGDPEVTDQAAEALTRIGWTPPDPIASGDYKPGCSREGCICHTPTRVCPEFMQDWQDAHCIRCGWSKTSHASVDIPATTPQETP